MSRYELKEGASSKFWEVEVEGAVLTVRFGRIGTQGQSKEKTFADAAAAKKEEVKLIKEKTGKGYVSLDGGAEPAVAAAAPSKPKKQVENSRSTGPEGGSASKKPVQRPAAEAQDTSIQEAAAVAPAAAAAIIAVPPAEEGTRKLFSARPLPTRMRPEPALTPGEAWRQLREVLQAAGESTGAAWREFPKRFASETPPDGLSVEEAAEWYKKLPAWTGYSTTTFTDLRTSKPHAAYNSAVALFTEWHVASQGPLAAVQAASKLAVSAGSQTSYSHSAWSDARCLALRAALTKAPEAAYEEALAWALAECAGSTDWDRLAYFAFVFADDRPAEHALQPLAVLRDATAQGIEKLAFFPLIADARPTEAAAWRTQRSYHFYFYYSAVSVAEACATVMAVAKAAGESAAPALSWLLYYARDQERTLVASALLETREPGALAELLPLFHEKWIIKAADLAAAAYPAYVFRECLTLSAAGRTEPAIRARLAELATRYGQETVRQWAESLGPKAINRLDSLFASAGELASAEALPAVLRDPPWRKKKSKEATQDIVLSIEPFATPYAYPEEKRKLSYDVTYRGLRPLAVGDMAQLPAFLIKSETDKKNRWANDHPKPDQPPRLDMTGDEALAWLKHRLIALNRVSSNTVRFSNYCSLYEGLERLPDPLALMLWELTGTLVNVGWHWHGAGPVMLSRFGEAALPGMLKLVESDPVTALDFARYLDTPGMAPLAARALLKLKKARALAIDWLRKHRHTALTRLIPDAVGPLGEARDAAEHALRWYLATDPQAAAELSALTEDYAKIEPRVREAIAQVLNRDPLGQYPSKIAKLPGWLVPAALARPVLRDSGAALPDEAIAALTEMLAFSTPDAVYAGVPMVREACTRESLGAFVWDLFSAWIAAGAPSKDGWAMRTIGWLGNDDCARKLTALIRKWPGEAAHARAVTGLDVLADIGSDVSLMNLNGIAEKVKFKGLQERAREKIAAIAEARDLTPEELADRLAPDLDLDGRGGLDLNFGPRTFRVGFDEFLKPWVKDANNVRLKDLPKPNKSDDPALSSAAVARWSALKKDARAAASMQLTRLENMLATSRRVRPDVFWAFFASHPLIRHLSQRLVWGLYEGKETLAKPSLSFHVATDLTFSDSQDAPVELNLSEEAKGLIGLVHPLLMPRDEVEAWGALFGDYEIMQPFPQLSRETYALEAGEEKAAKIARFKGIQVESARLRGMPARGWQLGSPQDGGGIWWIEREVGLAKEGKATVQLSFHDGLVVGAPEFEDKFQTLESLEMGGYGNPAGLAFGDLDAVTASEMLRGVMLLVQAGKS